MKKFLVVLLSVLFILPCALILTACNNSDEDNLAVYYENNLEEYNIESISFCSSYQIDDSTISVSSYSTNTFTETNIVGVKKDELTENKLYIKIDLKPNTILDTLKMMVNDEEVNLNLVTSAMLDYDSYIYEFDNIPQKAKLTFSGKASYIVSSFKINFNDVSNSFVDHDSVLSARFALKTGNQYLIGSSDAGVNYQSFKTQYSNINKSWVLSDKLYIDVYFEGNEKILSTSKIVEAEILNDEESTISPNRLVSDGKVSFEFVQQKQGIDITLKPNFLAYNTIEVETTMGVEYCDLTPDEIKYVIGDLELETITYSQIKDAKNLKIKMLLDEFLKTLLNSDKTNLFVNSTVSNNVKFENDYAIIDVESPWNYYNEGGVLNNQIEILTYYIEIVPKLKEDIFELYSLSEIFLDNNNLSKIEFEGINDIYTNINNGGYAGGFDSLQNSLYVDIDYKGQNYFAGFRNGKNFSINCKIAYLNENLINDYSKKIKIEINSTTTIILSYNFENKLEFQNENITVSTIKDDIVSISFNDFDVTNISFGIEV
ncbi:MAG: hypothetical protein ACI4TI_01625 [Christensenellales bacterium]